MGIHASAVLCIGSTAVLCVQEQIAEDSEKRKCEKWDERMKPYLAEARGAEAKDLDVLTKEVVCACARVCVPKCM